MHNPYIIEIKDIALEGKNARFSEGTCNKNIAPLELEI